MCRINATILESKAKSGPNTIKSHIPPSKPKGKARTQIDKRSRKTHTVGVMAPIHFP